MTIKQNGGVFGRNPTFNDVKVEGDLTVDGAVVHTGDLTIDNINISGNTISSTNTNGNILLDPNGTGYSLITAPTNGTIAQYGDTGSRTFFLKQANVGGYDNDTLIHESDSGVGQFQWKNSSNTLATLAYGGNLTLAVGNLVVASGQGIDFSATSGTGTSELFDDYEEGTWTPTIAAGSGTFTTVSAAGRYTKTGRMVIAQLRIFLTDSTGGSGWINISNFPFANSQASYAVAYGESPSGQMIRGTIGASSVNLFEYDNTDPVVNGNYSVTLIYEAT